VKKNFLKRKKIFHFTSIQYGEEEFFKRKKKKIFSAQ